MAVIRQVCKSDNFKMQEDNFVVAHLGGGISVSAISKGKCIDVSNGLEEGPFTPERSGSLPTIKLLDLCFSGKYTKAEIKKMLVGKGGLTSYLGTSNMIEIADKIREGNKEYEEVFDAMAYQIAKTIGSYVAVHKGNVKRIVLTGGGANNTLLVDKIKSYVECFAPVKVMPGEDELSALAQGALRVLRKESEALTYKA
jgi:butyrate kinase